MRLPHARAACTGPCGCSSCSCSLLSGSSPVPPRLACLCQSQLLYPALLSRRLRDELRVLSPGSLPRGRSLPFLCLPLPSLAFPCFPLPPLSFPSLPFPSLGLLLDLAREGQLLLHSQPTQEAGLSLEQHMAARCTQRGAAGCTATRGQKHRRDRRAKAH